MSGLFNLQNNRRLLIFASTQKFYLQNILRVSIQSYRFLSDLEGSECTFKQSKGKAY